MTHRLLRVPWNPMDLTAFPVVKRKWYKMNVDEINEIELDDVDSLAEALDEELPGDERSDGSPVEDPPDSDDDDEQEQVHDDDDPDADDSDDDPDSDDEEEDEEDPDDEDDDETIAEMQARIDKKHAQLKQEEERAAKLEEELEEAERQLQDKPKAA